MGHHRLGPLPASKLWRQVVDLLRAGADLDVVAAAAAEAAESSFEYASRDPAFLHAFWLLTQIPLAAQGPDFAGDLHRLGIDVPDGPHLFDITSALSNAVDDHSQSRTGRTDLGEMAKLAAVETLSAMVGPHLPYLFAPSSEEVRKTIRRFASGDNFSKLAREFFARLTQRSLHYYLSRELSNHIGPEERFADDGQQVAFNQALDRHCREASRIVEAFAGGWYGKNVHQGDGLTPDYVHFCGARSQPSIAPGQACQGPLRHLAALSRRSYAQRARPCPRKSARDDRRSQSSLRGSTVPSHAEGSAPPSPGRATMPPCCRSPTISGPAPRRRRRYLSQRSGDANGTPRRPAFCPLGRPKKNLSKEKEIAI